MLGPALGVALALDHARATRLRPLLPWAASLGILVLGVLSARQTAVWQSRSTLNAHAVRTNPRTYGARLNLAATLIDEGKIAEAADILRRAVEANPDYVKARYELGSTLHKLGELAEAEVHYEAAIRLRPQWSYVHNDLGILLAQQGRLTDALARFRAAVALRPDLPGPRQNLQQVERLLAGPSSPDPGNGETPPSAKPGQGAHRSGTTRGLEDRHGPGRRPVAAGSFVRIS
jgi:tetratricopeptide (TPR) repeat protein